VVSERRTTPQARHTYRKQEIILSDAKKAAVPFYGYAGNVQEAILESSLCFINLETTVYVAHKPESIRWTGIRCLISSSSHRMFRVSLLWNNVIFFYPVALSEFGASLRQHTQIERMWGVL